MPTYSIPNGAASGDPNQLSLHDVLGLWSQFSPEAQLAQQLRQMQVAEQVQRLQSMRAASQYATSMGFPSLEAMKLSQESDISDARLQETKDYHTSQVAEQESKSRDAATKEVMPLFIKPDGSVDQIGLSKYLAAKSQGKEGDFLGGFSALLEGKQKAQGVTAKLGGDPKAKLSPEEWMTLWQYGDPNAASVYKKRIPSDPTFWGGQSSQPSVGNAPAANTPTPATPVGSPAWMQTPMGNVADVLPFIGHMLNQGIPNWLRPTIYQTP